MKKSIELITTELINSDYKGHQFGYKSWSNALETLSDFYATGDYKASLSGNVVTITHRKYDFSYKYVITYSTNFNFTMSDTKRMYQIIENVINLKLIRYMRHINAGA